jgi:putative transposase
MKRKYYNIPGHFHYLTFTCYQRKQFLNDATICQWLADNLDLARSIELFRLYSYVFMPEHIHLLIQPARDEYSMSQIMRRIKEPFTRRVVAHWKRTFPEKMSQIQAKFGSRIIFRFWQAGGGYDRNLFDLDKIKSVIEYIEYNPVRRGLVANPIDWKWSSARARSGHTDVPLRIDKLEI